MTELDIFRALALPETTPAQRLVAVHIAAHGSVRWGVPAIAEATGLTHRTVKSSLRRLRYVGAIERTAPSTPNRPAVYRWRAS